MIVRIACCLLLTFSLASPDSLGSQAKEGGIHPDPAASKSPEIKGASGSTIISPGQCIDGELASGDRQFQDNTFFDEYLLDWPGGTLEVTLSSEEFDEYLIVIDPMGARTDVDTVEGVPPEVFNQSDASAGTYTIWSNSYSVETGAYRVCVNSATIAPTPTPCPPEPTPFSPQPADGATPVPVDTDLSWNNTPQDKVIYGADDRRDIYQVSDPDLLEAYESTVVLVSPGNITNNGDGTFTLADDPWTSIGGTQLCADEPFWGQPNPGFCSGFLVGPDLVATAGHCVTGLSDCGSTYFVFGFEMISASTPVLTVPESDVYQCSEVVGRVLSGSSGEDWALIRLSRPVEGRKPLSIRREGMVADNQGLVMIGYPSGLPGKIAGGANVRTNSNPNFFVANTDSYGGNSGSAVLNANTLEVEGILVRGETDFVNSGGCMRSNQCPDNGCRGEDITRITRLADLIPPPPQYLVYFGPCGALQMVGTTGDTSWDLPPLNPQTAYCWRIDVDNGCATTPGVEWSFTTNGIAPTPTPTQGPCDSGYYILDSFGARHRVGNPPLITGSVSFGNDIARDLEKADCPTSPTPDLVVLDGFGVPHFVGNSACNIPQDFYFEDFGTYPQGRAVDMQLTADSAGFWVLTDYGEIHLAGSAINSGTTTLGIGRSGILGFDIPTMRDEGTSNLTSNGTSLRAVAFFALDEDGNSQAEAYVVLDSMSGQFRYEADGSEVIANSRAGEPENDPEHLLDPASIPWPFFPGLDIARDMELHPSQQGVVILDGWDGIHPVPAFVPSNPVWFAQNEDSTGAPTQSVGMPYVIHGFDDPTTTGVDESDPDRFGIDAASVFTDLELSADCPSGGLYTLDRFGGVFALGAARPVETETSPNFGDSPYFFPFLLAENMEFFGFSDPQTPEF
jgi:hypothetical protein